MRIVHLLNHVKNAGNGIVNIAIDLAAEQKRAGHDVTIIAGGGSFETFLIAHEIELVRLDGHATSANPLAKFKSHTRALRRIRPDVIHAHMRSGLLAALGYAKWTRTPLLGHVHNVQEWQSQFFIVADRAIAVSSSVRDTLRKMGFPERKLRVVLNGPVDGLRFDGYPNTTVPLNHPAIVTVAGLNERKGIADLIDAFELVFTRFPEAHLYIIGEGDGRKKFEKRAALSRAAGNVVFLGFQADPYAFLRASDVFVLASHRESFGLVLLEARSAGCAIVSTNVDGTSEALEGGRCALMVPPRDPAALAKAISRLIEDEDLRHRLATLGMSGIQSFSAAIMARNVEAIYREALARRS